MSIQTRIKLLWGAFGLIVSSLLLSWAYATVAMNNQQRPVLGSPNEPVYGALVRTNLDQIGTALFTYARDNGDQLPPRLSLLYPQYVSDPAVFWNPGDDDPPPTTIDNDEPNRPNSSQVSFAYVARTRSRQEGVVLLDNSLANNEGSGVYALKSGSVPYVSSEFFEIVASPPSWMQVARSNLHQLGTALLTYANENNGFYPDRLSQLYPAYVSDPLVFWNPGDNGPGAAPAPTTISNDVSNLANSAQISFDYLGAGYTSTCPPGTVLLRDNSAGNNGGAVVNLLTKDLTVTTCIQTTFCNDSASCRVYDQRALGIIGNAVWTYANDNRGYFPTHLSMLYRTIIHDPTFFWSHGDSDPRPFIIESDAPNQVNSTQISYTYIGGTQWGDELAIVAQDNTMSNNQNLGLHVLTTDGAVYFFERCSRSLPTSATARANLLQIAQAIQSYSAANAGRYPEKLSLLYPAYISGASVFWNPGDKNACPSTISSDKPNASNSAQISFNYLGAGYSAGCDPGLVLVADNSLVNNGGVGINVLTANGEVGYFAPAFENSCRSANSCTAVARGNLYRIWAALLQYSYSDDDYLPPNLSTLYMMGLVSRPTDFWHPGDSDQWPITISNDGVNQPDSAQISFEYLAPGLKLSSLGSDEVLVRDNSPENNAGNGRLVLYADGGVKYVPIRSIVNIAISGPDLVPEGGTANYACTVTYDDGFTRDVTSESGWWTSELPGYFAGSGTYVLSRSVLADTPNTIHVRYMDEASRRLETKKTITVQNTVRVPTSLTISSGPTTVLEGGYANYTCTATYDDGGTEDVTALASWSMASGQGSFPTAGTYVAPGTVLADTPVTIKVSYSREGVTKEATKNITIQNSVRVLTGVAISSGPASVNEGTSANYTCTATYDDGGTEDVTASAVWSVASGLGSFPTAGTYAAPGTVTADTPVMLLATCTKGGVTRQATRNITVRNSVRIYKSLSISSGPASVSEGGSANYTCTATYDDNTTQNVTASATWSVISGQGSFPNPGAYVAPASVDSNKNVTIQAIYTEAGATKSATRGIVVTDGLRQLVGISIGGPATVDEGETAAYTCTATYDDNTTQDVTITASWDLQGNPGSFSQADPGVYAAPASVLADTPVTLYVAYGQGGVARQASKSITVLNSKRQLIGILISAGPAEVAEAGTAEYVCTATYDDNSTDDVTDQATWSVTSGPGTFSSPGMFAAPDSVLADTSATLFVSYTQEAIIRQASVGIKIKNTIRRLAGVSISSGPSTLIMGRTGRYTCVARYDDGSTQEVTKTATWTVVNGPGSFSAAGQYAAPGSVSQATAVTIKAKLAEGGITREVTKVIRIEPTDADGDGVADGVDRCPGTSAGAAVDANGCAASQRDSDGDSVADDRDECPATPAGTAVQSNGCVLSDRDQDGIADALDNCPDLASANRSDRDNDGHGDACDQCPDDASKIVPGTCGCGVPETADCDTTPVYTVRVITSEGAPLPYTYQAGTWAEIAAPAAPEGMRFSHWSGAYSGTDVVARVYVDGDKELVANYEALSEEPAAPCGAGAPVAYGVVGTVLVVAMMKRRYGCAG